MRCRGNDEFDIETEIYYGGMGTKVEHSDAEPEVYYANFILPEAWGA